MTGGTLYEQVGGADAIALVVNTFYEKIYSHKAAVKWFDQIPKSRQVNKMTKFLTYALGGTDEWKGRDMKTAHARLVKEGLGDGEFDLVKVTMAESLKECGVPDDLVEQIANIVESQREIVLGRV